MKYTYIVESGKLYENHADGREFLTRDYSLDDALEYMNCAHGIYIDKSEVELKE